MKSKTIKFRDPVVENVVDKFISRSDFGFEKYGQSMHNERITKQKDLAGYLNDIQEELMDAILYIQAAREELAEQEDLNILSVNSPLPGEDKLNEKDIKSLNQGIPYYVTDVTS